jgi:hypothetical protein
VRPQAEDLDYSFGFENLINEPMLNVDATGKRAGEVSQQLLEGWGGSARG